MVHLVASFWPLRRSKWDRPPRRSSLRLEVCEAVESPECRGISATYYNSTSRQSANPRGVSQV
jgi:hypothetical protein